MFHRLPVEIIFRIVQCTKDKNTLFKIALTCQALSEPALELLWHTMDSVVPLLLMLPMELYDQNELEQSREWARILPRVPTLHIPEKDWRYTPRDLPCFARIIEYGKRIRVLRGINAEKLNVSCEAFQFFFDYMPHIILSVNHVIPNLTTLSCIHEELASTDFNSQIHELFVPGLETVTFTFDCKGIYEDFYTVMLNLLRECPSLKVLQIICTEETRSPVEELDLEEFDSLSITTPVPPLEVVQVIHTRGSGYCSIVCAPMTLVVLGALRSITCLDISVETADLAKSHAHLMGLGSAFPRLQYLRLKLYGPHPFTWFFAALSGAELRFLYLQFVKNISASQLDEFMSSLDLLEQKFFGLTDFGLRASVYNQDDRSQEPLGVIPSMVAAAARLAPSLGSLKLKLLSPVGPQRGLVRPDHLPQITGTFPRLHSLKLATSPLHFRLSDVVSLARSLPGLRAIGMDFQCSEVDFPPQDEPLGGLPPCEEHPGSDLRVLNVRHSAIEYPEKVAGYLRESLPRLFAIVKSRKSTHNEWDTVCEMLRDRE